MDDEIASNQPFLNHCGGDAAFNVSGVTTLQSDGSSHSSDYKHENIQTEETSSQENNVNVDPQAFPGRELARVRTLPNVARITSPLTTSSFNNLQVIPSPRTESALQSDQAVAVQQTAFTTSLCFKKDDVPSNSKFVDVIGEHNVSSVSGDLPEKTSSVDQCPQRIFQDLLGSFQSTVFDHSHNSSSSAVKLFILDDRAGKFCSPSFQTLVLDEKQNKLSTVVSNTDTKRISVTKNKSRPQLKKSKKCKLKESSKDTSSIDEVSEKNTVELHKSKKKLSFKVPIEDGTPKCLTCSSKELKETNQSKTHILKNKGNTERSRKKNHSAKATRSKSSSPSYSEKKCLSDKVSASSCPSRKNSITKSPQRGSPSRERSVERYFSDVSVSKNKVLVSRGRSATKKNHSNRSIKDTVRFVESQLQTNTSSKTQKNTSTIGSKSKRTTSNKSLKDNDNRGGSISNFSSMERISKKTCSGKNGQSKQRNSKDSREVPPNKDSSSIRNKITACTAMEKKEKVREWSKDRIEIKTLSKTASQPIRQRDTSNISPGNTLPKVVSEINHYHLEQLKNNMRIADIYQLRVQNSTTNRRLREEKLKMQSYNSVIDVVPKKQPVREFNTQSKRRSSSVRSFCKADGTHSPDRHETKNRRVTANDRPADSSSVDHLRERHSKSRSQQSHSSLKFPSKDKVNIEESSSEPQCSVKRRNANYSKEIPDARQSSSEASPKTQRNIKASPKDTSDIHIRSNVHSIEVTIKPKNIPNTEKKSKEVRTDSSGEIANKCLLTFCRPVSDVKIKKKSVLPSDQPVKQTNKKIQSKENLSKEKLNGEKSLKVFSISDKEAKGDTLNEKIEDESKRKVYSKERTTRGHSKSTDEKQKSVKTDRRKLPPEQTTNKKLKKKETGLKNTPRYRFTKQRGFGSCCGGRSPIISVKTRKRLETRLGIRNETSKSDETSPVHSNKEILTIHRSSRSRSHSRLTGKRQQRKIPSRDLRYSDESETDSDYSDSSETNVAILRERRNVHPYIPRIRRQYVKYVKPISMNPDPVLYRKSSIRLIPVHGLDFGIMYPVDSNAPEPALRSIGSSIAKESKRVRKVSQIEEKPQLFYESVSENLYQTPRSQSIVGHDLIAPAAPTRRVPPVARLRCLVHDKRSGPAKYHVRVRSPPPCICRHPQRALVSTVPARFNPSTASCAEKFGMGYQFKDISYDTPRRRSDDRVKEFLYDLGKSILPPERYRGKLVSYTDLRSSNNFRSRMPGTNNGSERPFNKEIRWNNTKF